MLTSPIWITLTSSQLGPIIESKNGVWWNSTAAEKTIFSTRNPGNSIFFLLMTSQAITLTAELRPSDSRRDPAIKGRWWWSQKLKSPGWRFLPWGLIRWALGCSCSPSLSRWPRPLVRRPARRLWRCPAGQSWSQDRCTQSARKVKWVSFSVQIKKSNLRIGVAKLYYTSCLDGVWKKIKKV